MNRLETIGILALVVLALPLLLAWVAVYLAWLFVWGAILRVWFWRKHAAQGRPLFFQRRVMTLAVLSLSPLFYIPLLLAIFGIRPDLAPAFFFTAIVAAIFQSSLLFADLVISIIVPGRGRS